jgi:general secretion pathway protein I
VSWPRGTGSRGRLHRQRGFSLLEALVAFAIMALALGMLYASLSHSVANLADTERRTHAMLLAQSLLELHEGIEPGGLDESGAFAGGYEWTATAAPAQGLEREAGERGWTLYELAVSVAWRDGDRMRSYEVVTLRPEYLPERRDLRQRRRTQ